MDAELRTLLKLHGFEQSMTRADETYDNAYAESLFSRYKTELLEDGVFADLEVETCFDYQKVSTPS